MPLVRNRNLCTARDHSTIVTTAALSLLPTESDGSVFYPRRRRRRTGQVRQIRSGVLCLGRDSYPCGAVVALQRGLRRRSAG